MILELTESQTADIIDSLSDRIIETLIDQGLIEKLIEEINVPAIAREAARTAVKELRPGRKQFYNARETAEILGITLSTLNERRARNAIKAIRPKGSREFLYAAEELERVIGQPLGK